MCLYPRLGINKKYTKTKKNGGIIPPLNDIRVKYVPIGCGKCMECMKQEKRKWQIRLSEEIKDGYIGIFVTLTFSNESIIELTKEIPDTIQGYQLDNQIATLATRRFLERWRKQHKKSLRHWLITELGHQGTENIHLHGIIWTEYKERNQVNLTHSLQKIQSHWKYGFIWPTIHSINRNYVNSKTVNYIIKYVNKIDLIHKYFKPKILSSPGIGARYINNPDCLRNKYNKNNTIETYKSNSGHESNLPIYYRNKLYTEEERELLWIEKLNKNERWICGEKIKADDAKELYDTLKWYRRVNEELGFGNDEKDWDREQYEQERRKLMYDKRKGKYN